MARTFVCENVDGEQFFLDSDFEGYFGAPALVNENNEVYGDDIHIAYSLIAKYVVFTSINKAMTDNVGPDEWAESNKDAIEEAIAKRFANKQWATDEELQELNAIMSGIRNT